MIVAQRNKGCAAARGRASRQQISRSVLFEAFVVGLVGGGIGLAVGIGLAALLKMLANSGTGRRDGPLTVTPAAVLAALFVGIVVTMVSAWVAAARCAVAPVRRCGPVPPRTVPRWAAVPSSVRVSRSWRSRSSSAVRPVSASVRR